MSMKFSKVLVRVTVFSSTDYTN